MLNATPWIAALVGLVLAAIVFIGGFISGSSFVVAQRPLVAAQTGTPSDATPAPVAPPTPRRLAPPAPPDEATGSTAQDPVAAATSSAPAPVAPPTPKLLVPPAPPAPPGEATASTAQGPAATATTGALAQAGAAQASLSDSTAGLSVPPAPVPGGDIDVSIPTQHNPLLQPLAPPPPAPKGAPGFTLQFGAFIAADNAARAIKMLKSRQVDAYLYKTVDSQGRPWHRVRIGQYRTQVEAARAAREFKAKDQLDTIVMRAPPAQPPKASADASAKS